MDRCGRTRVNRKTDLRDAAGDEKLKVAALFTGGMGSIYSIHLSQQSGLEVVYLITAHARESRMYHFIPLKAAEISAKALKIPLVAFFVPYEDEVTPLRDSLVPLEIEGLCCGAVSSNYQRNRVMKVCENLGLELVMPLWHKDPFSLLEQMIDSGFKIMITRISKGLDEIWLGRVLDQDNLADFLAACEKGGIDPMRRGREYETLVIEGPNMSGRVCIESEKRWSGYSVELKIMGARLLKM